MTDQSEWTGKVGNVWADEWRRTDRSFGPVTERLLQVARAAPFAQALDIGCGAGEISVDLAKGAPSSRVLGVDISDDLLDVARARSGDLPNLRFELADAASWMAGEAEKPDLLVSRHGVMFFADPAAAFSISGAHTVVFPAEESPPPGRARQARFRPPATALDEYDRTLSSSSLSNPSQDSHLTWGLRLEPLLARSCILHEQGFSTLTFQIWKVVVETTQPVT